MMKLSFLALLLCTPIAGQEDATKRLEQELASLSQAKDGLQKQLASLESQIAAVQIKISQEKLREAQARGELLLVRVAVDNAPVFNKPEVTADMIAQLPKGTSVQVLGKPGSLWEVVASGIHGYMGDVALDKSDPEIRSKMGVMAGLPPSLGQSQVSSQPAPVSEPATPRPLVSTPTKSPSSSSTVSGSRTSSSSPSRQTSSQCLGTTKKGARCKRMTTDPSGYCYQHK